MVWYGVVWCGMVWYNVVLCDVSLYGVVGQAAIWYGMGRMAGIDWYGATWIDARRGARN